MKKIEVKTKARGKDCEIIVLTMGSEDSASVLTEYEEVAVSLKSNNRNTVKSWVKTLKKAGHFDLADETGRDEVFFCLKDNHKLIEISVI